MIAADARPVGRQGLDVGEVLVQVARERRVRDGVLLDDRGRDLGGLVGVGVLRKLEVGAHRGFSSCLPAPC